MRNMTDNTRLALIDKVRAALVSRMPEDLLAARYTLQVQCKHAKIDMLAFLADEVFTLPVAAAEMPEADKCPFCGKQMKGLHGLKTHISIKHQKDFETWKKEQVIR